MLVGGPPTTPDCDEPPLQPTAHSERTTKAPQPPTLNFITPSPAWQEYSKSGTDSTGPHEPQETETRVPAG
jgi:hypothetical protein